MSRPTRKDAWRDEEIEFLRNNYHGMTRGQIAKRLGRTPAAVGIMARRLGLLKREAESFTPIEMSEDRKALEREFFAVLLAAWREGNKDVGRVIDYFHTERRIIHGWQAETKRFGVGSG